MPKKILIRHSGLTGTIYAVTDYTEKGQYLVIRKKQDVTEDAVAAVAQKYGATLATIEHAHELLVTLKDVLGHLRSITLDPGDDDDAPALVAAEQLVAIAEGE